MNKLFIIFLAAAMLAGFTACTGKKVTPREPEPLSDIESIIEPVEQSESVKAPDPESESEPSEADLPAPVSSRPESIASTPPAQQGAPAPSSSSAPLSEPVPPAPSSIAQSESEPPDQLHAVAPDPRLDAAKIESELFRLINGLRYEAGVEALGLQEQMRFAARIRSEEALTSFSHTRPDDTPYNTVFDEAGFPYAGKWHGENLSSLRFTEGMLDEESAALEMFNGLKNSPGHYQNMVRANFIQAGIGVSITYGKGNVDIASAQLFSSL